MKGTIIGTGSWASDAVITNEDLEKRVLGVNAKWTEETLGIRQRHISPYPTSISAVKAGEKALENAGISPLDINLIIVATATPDFMAPSTAALVQHKIGAVNAAAFDLNAVCAGFLYALHVANQFIIAQTYKNILIIGADTFSQITDWDDRSCIFFGDGAGAVVLSGTPNGGIIGTDIYSDGSGENGFKTEHGKTFVMNGQFVYKSATTLLPQAITSLLQKTNVTKDKIKWVIPHQPSIQILKKLASTLDIPFERVKTNMDKYANTSAATIPILLDEVNRAGQISRGDVILFAAIGSGWVWGASIMEWTL
jgi:3-oxoacyl-[acyl-carrier-protein] synthase-3